MLSHICARRPGVRRPGPRGRVQPGCSTRKAHHESASCRGDRKSTRLNSSHGYFSYAVFCLKKKNKIIKIQLNKSQLYLHFTNPNPNFQISTLNAHTIPKRTVRITPLTSYTATCVASASRCL